MTDKSPDLDQRVCFDPLLREFINPKHELAIAVSLKCRAMSSISTVV